MSNLPQLYSEEDRLYTREDFARFLGVTAKSLRNRPEYYGIPKPNITLGHSPRWTRQEFQRWKEAVPEFPASRSSRTSSPGALQEVQSDHRLPA